MLPQDRNVSLAEYLSGLHFDRVDAYSFQRGAAYEETLAMQRQERDALKRRQLKSNDLSLGEERRLERLEAKVNRMHYLIDEQGNFHASGKNTASFSDGDQLFTRLKTILTKPQSELDPWMCAPVYRDALVFYQGNAIVSALNVCLSCNRMESMPLTYVGADDETFVHLRQFFVDIGHKVEM